MSRTICPDCGNNACLLYPEYFAQQHLKGADREWYQMKKKELDEWLLLKFNEHIHAVEGG